MFDYLVNELNIPSGKKASIVRVPNLILNSCRKVKKYFFLGLLLTDRVINKRGRVLFHMASRGFIIGYRQDN